MPWLGFSFAKRPPGGTTTTVKKQSDATSSTTKEPKSNESIESDDEFSTGTDEKPTIRMLKPEEVEKLQSENEQLKQLIQQLSEKAKLNPQTNPGANSSAYPNLAASSSSSSSTPSDYTFQKIHDMKSFLHSSASPSAPPMESANNTSSSSRRASNGANVPNIPPEEIAPVSDFYESLRKSLSMSKCSSSSTPSKSASSTSSSSAATMAYPSLNEEDTEEDEDEWGTAKPTVSAPKVQESVHAPRTEDEAIVHNKYSSVVVHKKPLRPVVDDDVLSASAATSTGPAIPKDLLDEMEGEDEFGMETETKSSTTAPVTSDEPEEEIAIFDVSQADWWYVVPHPDRVNEELVSAPQPSLDPAEDEDGFVLIKSKDSLTALGEFISSMMSRHPEIAKLSPEQVRDMIEQSLLDRGITEPSTAGKMWQWGKQVYSIWSWTNWGVALYKDQTAIRLVAAGVIKAATWTCVFLM